MRLYIPTSSLNADNILACESIAPASECRRRQFGYSHFDVLPELRTFDNVTLAFSKIPTFSVNDSDRECFAMVVAIDIEDLGKYQIQAIGTFADTDIFATANPILISPSTTQILFFNERAKSYTLHSCSDSAKCKLFDFYKSRFGIVDKYEYGETLRTYLENLQLPNIETSYSENDFDAAKGFIWGYGIGALLSIPQDIAKLLKIQKRIYDIVSSTKNEDFMSTALSDELARLDAEYSSADPIQKAIKTAWTEYLQSFVRQYLTAPGEKDIPVSNIDAFLKAINAETSAKNTFLVSRGYKLRKKLAEYMNYGKSGYEYYSRDIESYTQQSLDRHRKQSESIQFASELDTDTDKYKTVMMSASDRNAVLFNKILSRVIWDKVVPSVEELRVNKASVARAVVVEIKSIIEEMGEQWADKPVQMYFNSMRKNITDFTGFNLNEIDDPVLQSLAAFLLKGEDFGSLKQYLEANAFSDYRYVFALWGAVSGYVSIPRSIIESEFNVQNTAHLFTEAQIALSLNSTIRVSPAIIPETITTSVPLKSTPVSNAIPLRDRVLKFFEKIKKGKRNQDQMEEELLSALNQLDDSDNSFLFICTLNDFSKWRNTSKAWQEMQAEFCPDYAEQIGKKRNSSFQQRSKTQQSKGLLDRIGLGGLFQRQDNAVEIPIASSLQNTDISDNCYFEFNLQNIDHIVSVIFKVNPSLSEFALKQIRNDLKWVFDPQYSSGKSQNELIDIFRSVLITGKTERRSKNGKDMKWKNEAYSSLDVERTIHNIRIAISR